MEQTALNWETLIAQVGQMDENTVKAWINYENSTYKRKSFLTRLHQRYCKLRDARERDELWAGRLL